MISLFDRAGSLARGLRRKPSSKQARRNQDRRLRLVIDQLESRLALAITSPLEIGGTTVGSFTDTPTGLGNLGDFVTVSIEGTRGTVIFNGGTGVADGSDIQTIEIVNASPDFQMTISASIQTANPVPYGSDGIVQLGAITTANVIRGINTVRGPLTNVAITTSPPIGFNQTTAGPTLTVEGDQTATWTVDSFIAATPLAPSSPVGSTAFGTVTTVSFDGNTNLTTITFDGSTPTGTTAGALTLASTIQPSFVLTSFVGVNFSNLNLKDGGGLFVDKVVGADTVINGTTVPNLGILLSQGLLAYSTIGIRDQLDAIVLLGTSRGASVDGRMFVETATTDSLIYVGPQNTPTSKNSKFQLTGGQAAFGAGVLVAQPFDGVVNLGGAATGSWVFARGVGPNAVLNADSWVGQTLVPPFFFQGGILVNGNFAGSVNATSGEDPSNGDITLTVTGNLAATARVNAGDFVSLSVLGSVLKGATVAGGGNSFIAIGKNFAGSMTAGGNLSGSIGGTVSGGSIVASNNLSLAIGGSIVNSALSADEDMWLDVAGSIRNSRLFSRSDTSIDVTGNVVNSSVTVGYDGSLSLGVGGNMSGSNAQTGSGNLTVNVTGNLTSSTFTSTSDNVTVDVGGDFLKNKIVTGDAVELTVGRDALNNTVIADTDVTLDIGRNWRGVAQSASSDLLLDVGGSVLKGSSFSSGKDTLVDVAGNFDGSTTSRDLRFFVGGNVSKASRIVAQRVTDWQETGTANFGIGGRFDGIVNVVDFDAAPDYQNVTLIGGGAGTSARFYVDRFNTDNLFFNGNYSGNLRVLQDLVANLNFGGNVDRITIGGRVGSFAPGNTIEKIPVSINVAGRLRYLNSNSYFQAAQPGKNGTFWNDATSTDPNSLSATGLLSTGSYVTVVPTRPATQTPAPIDPQTYTAPSAPPGFSAKSQDVRPAGILVTFQAATSDGGLPVVFYEYSTNGTDGTPTWRRFDNPAQGPGTDVVLTKDSAGNALVFGTTYQVAVRAVNAIGATGTTPSAVQVVAPPLAPATFSASATTSPDGIKVSFTAPTNDGGLPVTYQYTTNALAGTPTWRDFDNPAQGPGTDIQLTVDSSGGPWLNNTYDVSVRAVNTLGNAAFTPSSPVTVILGP
jgi:hypothetical protein